jgi:hypothetical protein
LNAKVDNKEELKVIGEIFDQVQLDINKSDKNDENLDDKK